MLSFVLLVLASILGNRLRNEVPGEIVAPLTLLVLDGWGVSQETKGNAIALARTPNYKNMLAKFPNSLVEASGECVGLPPGLMGNSEVGHLNIGAGRVVMQKLTQISATIADGTFFTNPILLEACRKVKANNRTLHLFGLLSDGCVHSSLDHLYGLVEMANRLGVPKLVMHAILDGRDTPPKSALRFVRDLEEKLSTYKDLLPEIGIVCGRYYAMDRDNRWERIEKFWRALVLGEGLPVSSAEEAIKAAYDRGETDEFVLPSVVSQNQIISGDSVICFNFRPDRVRQISRAMTQASFDDFVRQDVPDIYFACLTEYEAKLNLPVAFSPEQLPSQDMLNTLPELLSAHQIGQFHTAETEKYAHVTYFFNGGKEQPYPSEERKLIPSLKVATYDLAPKMQTKEVCQVACQTILSGKYPFIVLNFANPDMVGHTGILEAAVEAVESCDQAFADLLDATAEAKGSLVITADHGNCEQMIDLRTGDPHTAHTTNPVPAVVADFSGQIKNGAKLAGGSLADIAPTILDILQMEKPKEMTGTSLIRRS